MAPKDIKTKIGATNRTHKVTRAMEAVSAVKMRKTQSTALQGRAYARSALSILTRLAGSDEMKRHPLSSAHGGKGIALIVITSDKGLAGSLNSGVLKYALQAIKEYAPEDVRVYAYGKKGYEFFLRRGYPIVASFENKGDDISLLAMQNISDAISSAFLSGEVREVRAVYTNFNSTFEQTPAARPLLPLSVSSLKELVEGIIPAKGKWSHESVLVAPSAYRAEPSDEAILDLLIPRLTAIALYHMLLESKASEHSARMVAMKNASDKSKEVARALTRVYNKRRQAAITREVSEIVSGREALSV